MERFREPNALQIRVTLDAIEPAIWRRLVVPWTWHLGQLHLAIQAAFNWWNYHLHEFRIGSLRYGDPQTEDEWATETSASLFYETDGRTRDFARDPCLSSTCR